MEHHDLYCSSDGLDGFTRNCCATFPQRKCSFKSDRRFEKRMGRPLEFCQACDQQKSCSDMADAVPAAPCCHQHASFERQHCSCGCANPSWGRRPGSDVAGDRVRPVQTSGHAAQRQFQRNSPSGRNMVVVYGWYLTKAQGGGPCSAGEAEPSVGIGGYKTLQRSAEELVQTARVELRLESRKLRAVDGTTICLKGMINLGKSVENGFPPTLVRYFIMGFPTAWIFMMMSLPTMMNCGRAIRYPWMSEPAGPAPDAASPSQTLSQDSSRERQGFHGETITVSEAEVPSGIPALNHGSCEASLRADHTGAASPPDEESLDMNASADEVLVNTTMFQQSKAHVSQSEHLINDYLGHAHSEELWHQPTSFETTACLYQNLNNSEVQVTNVAMSERNIQIPDVLMATDGNAAAVEKHGGMINQEAQELGTHVTLSDIERMGAEGNGENANLPAMRHNIDRANDTGEVTAGSSDSRAEVHERENLNGATLPPHIGDIALDDACLPESLVAPGQSLKDSPNTSENASSPDKNVCLDPSSEAFEASDVVPNCDNAPSEENSTPVDGGVLFGDTEEETGLESRIEVLKAREDAVVADPAFPDAIPELLENDEGMNVTGPPLEVSGDAEPARSLQDTRRAIERRCRRLSFAKSSETRPVDVQEFTRKKKTSHRPKNLKGKRISNTAAEGENTLKDARALPNNIPVVMEEGRNDPQTVVPSTPLPNSRKRKRLDSSPGEEVSPSAKLTDKGTPPRLRETGEGRVLRSGRRLAAVYDSDRAMRAGNQSADQDIRVSGDAFHTVAGTQADIDPAESFKSSLATVAPSIPYAANRGSNPMDGHVEAKDMENHVKCAPSGIVSPNDAEWCDELNVAASTHEKERRKKVRKFYGCWKKKSCAEFLTDLDAAVVFNDHDHPAPSERSVESDEVDITTLRSRERNDLAGTPIAPPVAALHRRGTEKHEKTPMAENDARKTRAGTRADTKSRKEGKPRKCQQASIDAHCELPGNRSNGRGRERRNRSANRKNIRKFVQIIPPPLPTPAVQDKSQVTLAYGLKKSRHGRVLVPPLAAWCNQSIKYDLDGSLIAISPGTRSKSEYSTVSYELPTDKIAKLLQRKFEKAAATVCSRS